MIKKLLPLILFPISLISVSCGKKTGNLIILYTANINGAISNELSYASLKKLKDNYKKKNDDVLIFDCGDHLSGGMYCNLNKGQEIINLMNAVGYDAACLGECEFEWDMNQLNALIKSANFPYISTNFYNYDSVNKKITDPVYETSKIFEVANKKIGVFSLSTPYTPTYVNPKHFKNDNNEYIYSFINDDDSFYKTTQNEIDNLKNKGADYVICLSHLGDDESRKFNSVNLIKKTKGISAVLDGHSHDVNPIAYVKDKDNHDVLLSQIGDKFENIGKLTISKNGNIINEIIDTVDDNDNDVLKSQGEIISIFNDRYSMPIAKSPISFTKNDKRTTNLGDICADSLYYFFNYVLTDPQFGSQNSRCDFAIENTGAMKNGIDSPIWSVMTARELLISSNSICVKRIKGSIIRKYFEFSTLGYDKFDFAGMPQVSATLQVNVDTSTTSDIVIDEAYNYVSGPINSLRVKRIQIYNTELAEWENLDDNKYYYVGSTDLVLEGGYGATMFAQENEDCKTIFKTSSLGYDFYEYQILAYFISSFSPSMASDLPTINSFNSPFPSDIKSTSNISYENSLGSYRINSALKN